MTKKTDGIVIDGKGILEKRSGRKKRKKVSLYLSEPLFEKFKRACSEASASEVMEDLIEAFLESLK